jgi:hypothetical protein
MSIGDLATILTVGGVSIYVLGLIGLAIPDTQGVYRRHLNRLVRGVSGAQDGRGRSRSTDLDAMADCVRISAVV